MLNSLHIKNFRSLKNFHVPRLGRVNLIVGKNNSGKSTVLEALRIYAGNANRSLLEAIAIEHDERIRVLEEDSGDISESFPFDAFFTGRKFPDQEEESIFIGQNINDLDAIQIQHGFLVEYEETATSSGGENFSRIIRRQISRKEMIDTDIELTSQALFVKKGDKGYQLRFDQAVNRLRSAAIQEIPFPTPCGVVPTRFVSASELADEWDRIVLTEYEEIVVNALKLINVDFEGLAFVNQDDYSGGRLGMRKVNRIAKVRLGSTSIPVPLNSMGDGISRILQLILKVFSARGGILLIDEFENGLHYSIQTQVWKLIFELALKLNIQVFATTHSWDCIASFSQVAIELGEVDGVLFRVGASVRNSDKGQVIATVFDENALANISQAEVDIR